MPSAAPLPHACIGLRAVPRKHIGPRQLSGRQRPPQARRTRRWRTSWGTGRCPGRPAAHGGRCRPAR
eukprot:5496493-Alexandrium_andersonii.AAC.1